MGVLFVWMNGKQWVQFPHIRSCWLHVNKLKNLSSSWTEPRKTMYERTEKL